MTNAYKDAIKDNGYTIVDGIKYAIGQSPYIDDHNNGIAYVAYGFTQEMLDDDGSHDPLFEDSVKLAWDCTDSCDWTNDAYISNQTTTYL